MDIRNLEKAANLRCQRDQVLQVLDALGDPAHAILLFRSVDNPVAQFTLDDEDRKEVAQQMTRLMSDFYLKKLKSIENQIKEL